jgi:hypothetical protein
VPVTPSRAWNRSRVQARESRKSVEEQGPRLMVRSDLMLKEMRFVNSFCRSAKGNATQAAREAGYGTARNAAHIMARRLLRKATIRKAIQDRVQRETAHSISAADERDRALSSIIRSPLEETRDQIAAFREMNRCDGRHAPPPIPQTGGTLSELLWALERKVQPELYAKPVRRELPDTAS